MKKHSGIIKEIGILLLLFVSVSAVAVSQDTNNGFIDTVPVFGKDSVWSSDGNTVTYEDENGEVIVEPSPPEDTDDTDAADGNGSDSDSSEGTGANSDSDPDIMPPSFDSDDLIYEEGSLEEWLELFMSSIAVTDMELPSLPE